MSFSSFLPQLLIPQNLGMALGVLGVALFLLRCRKSAGAAWLLAVAWPLAWSLPATSLWAGGWLEHRYPYRAPDALPQAQAIIVLGGNTANGRANWFEPYDSATARTRVDSAALLYHAGRAPRVIVSGAALEGNVSEARIMAAGLRQHNIPEQAIILEDQSDTTRENGFFTAKLLRSMQAQDVLLVTSALHMPRAMAVFSHLGVQAIPAPSPPQIIAPRRPGFSRWLPDARTLDGSRSILKEYVGLFVYWLRDWV